MATIFNYTTKALIKAPLTPGMTRDNRAVLRLAVLIDSAEYVLNVVSKQGMGIEQLADYLTKNGIVKLENDKWTIELPTWSIAKARNNTVWVHVEDYEKLKGATT
jgi:chaperonin GroEL (HSP60 family)